MVLVLKIKWREEFRRLSLQKNPTFRELINQLRELFHLPTEILVVKYVDEEQDLITITSDLEWNEAIRSYVDQQLSVLKLFLAESLSQVPHGVRPEEEIQFEIKKVAEIEVKKEESAPPAWSVVETPKEEVKPQIQEEPIVSSAEVTKEEPEEEQDEPSDHISFLDEDDEHSLEAAIQLENDRPHKAQLKEYKARRGNSVLIDTSLGALGAFGLEHGERVNTPNGPGKVIGVGHTDGFLWFQLDRDHGVSFWDDVRSIDDLWCKGITLRPAEAPANYKLAEPKKQTTAEEEEMAMIQRAIQESLLDQKQKEIQTNFRYFGNNSNGKR